MDIYIYIYIYMRAKKNRAPNKSRIREHKARGCNQRVVWVRERSATGAGKDLPAPAQMCALRKNKPPRRKTRENRAGGCHQCVVDYAWGFHWSATHRLLFAARGRSHPAPRGASAVWRMEQGGRSLATCLCFVARKSPRFLRDGPYRLARGILSVVRTSVVHRVAGPGPIGTWGPPLAPAFVLLAVLGGGARWWWAWAQSASHASCCSGSMYMYAHGLTMGIYIYAGQKNELRINHVYGNTEQGVATTALCGRGSGAPQRRALRGACCKTDTC
jgi:hypothetical protein